MNLRLIISLLFVNISLAGTTGKLSGTVKEADSNNFLIGCNIIIIGTDLGTATDIDGQYFLLNIPPGTYNVKFQMIGYETVIINDVVIAIDKTTRLNSELATEVIAGSEVVVTAERKLIQFDVTQSEARITSEELEFMPVTEVLSLIHI